MSQIHRQTLQRALALHQQGQLAQAIRQYDMVLALDSGNFDALQLKGLALYQSGEARVAIDLLNKAIRRKADMPQVYNNRGLAQQALGNRAAALQDFSKAISLAPSYAEAHCNKGIVLREMKRLEEATACCTQALKLNPNMPAFYNALGVVRSDAGDWTTAMGLFETSLALQPADVGVIVNRANALREMKRHAEALAGYDQAIRLQPRHAEVYSNRGRVLLSMARLDEALASFETSIILNPNYAEAHSGRATVLTELNRLEEAVASCDRAIALAPDQPSAYANRGNALLKGMRPGEALASYDRALALSGGTADIHCNRAAALLELNRDAEALASCNAALALRPDHPAAHSVRARANRDLMHLADAASDIATHLRLQAAGDAAEEGLAADWARLLSVDAIPGVYDSEEHLQETRRRVEDTLDDLLFRLAEPHTPSAALSPVSASALTMLTGFYLAYHQENDRETMRKLSTAARRLLGHAQQEPSQRRAGGGPIRVGIASQRLRNHNGANWAYEWFARLPRGDYEFFTYNFEALEDDLSGRFAALGKHRQLSFRATSMASVLQCMRADQLDALMLPDVGMTPTSRFLSLHRIAPLQFTAWGHPVTSGSAEIDAYLSSDLMEPAEAQDHYTERLVRLPNLALYLEERSRPGGETRNFGLPDGRVLYGCLQSTYKYLPRHDGIYPEIAREVPEALFVFVEGSADYMTQIMRRRLDRAFAARGLDAARHVLFLPRQTGRDFDALMRQMHVNVDSIGWSGGNTSLTAIFSGLPLLTMEGRFMRGRHTSAMFAMMGAAELVARSREDYVQKLVAMGRDRDYRSHAAELIRANAPQLCRDSSVVTALDGFLKSRCAT